MGSQEISCGLIPDKKSLELNVPGEDLRLYPYVWLRDNCLCEECYNAVTQSRKTRLKDLAFDVEIKEATVKQTEESEHLVQITWDDGHISTFHTAWLIDRTFPNKGHQPIRSARYRAKPQLWDSEMAGKLPRFDFNQLTTEDAYLYDWIVTLDRVGVTIITAAPTEEGQIERLASKISFLRSHNYGKEFKVRSKVSPSNAAYTTCDLDLHTDLPHYHQPPGTQLLHCIIQAGAGGGDSTVCDGFHAAKLLRERHPDYFQLLCRTKLDFNDLGDDAYGPFHQLYHGPVFKLDCYGELEELNYSVHCRDSYMGDLALEDVALCYRALRTYDDLLREHQVTYLLQPGEILVVDNRRVLHGRKGYTVTPGGERLLEGGYIDWDHLYSRMRVLAKQLNKT